MCEYNKSKSTISRYREKDSRMPNWIELPVNPPNARKIQIHNLSAGTSYEFQVSMMHMHMHDSYSGIILFR